MVAVGGKLPRRTKQLDAKEDIDGLVSDNYALLFFERS